MRNYELAYIADPDLDENALTALEEKIKGWVEAAGGSVVKVDRWGKRRMAYTIKKRHDGHYFFVTATLPTASRRRTRAQPAPDRAGPALHDHAAGSGRGPGANRSGRAQEAGMSRGLNKVMVIGHLGRDPEMRYTPSGRPVATFTVATTRAWHSSDGERHEETEWFNVVAWGSLAEICNQHLTAGPAGLRRRTAADAALG